MKSVGGDTLWPRLTVMADAPVAGLPNVSCAWTVRTAGEHTPAVSDCASVTIASCDCAPAVMIAFWLAAASVAPVTVMLTVPDRVPLK